MARLFVGALLVTIIGTATSVTQARTLVFYAVPHVSEAPRIDGDLSDPAWRDTPAADTYYEYWKPEPGLGALRTEFRMVHGERGIYLAILNHDQNLDRLRANITVRDDPRLWQDDCAEIYFDPAALGVGYTKFVTNSIGTQQDLRRLDAAVTLDDWSGYGWEVATGRNDQGWTIEAFFPWSDLGARAEVGDLWMFNHVRYAYTSGSFKGVTWSPGGAYNRPENFGYLYFADDAAASPRQMAELVGQTIQPPWQLPTSDGIHVADGQGRVRFYEASQWIDQRRASVKKILAQARTALDQLPADQSELRVEFENLQSRYEQIAANAESPAEALDIGRRLDELASEIDELYWRSRLQALLTDRGP